MTTPTRDQTWPELLTFVAGWLASQSGRTSSTASAVWAEVQQRLESYGTVVAITNPNFREEDIADAVGDILLRLQNPDFVARLREVKVHAGYFRRMIYRSVVDQERARRRETLAWQREPADPLPVPGDPLIEVLEAARQRGLLDALPPEDRELLRLRFGLDWTVVQIAERLGIRVSTAASRIQRLLDRLR